MLWVAQVDVCCPCGMSQDPRVCPRAAVVEHPCMTVAGLAVGRGGTVLFVGLSSGPGPPLGPRRPRRTMRNAPWVALEGESFGLGAVMCLGDDDRLVRNRPIWPCEQLTGVNTLSEVSCDA